MKQKISSLVFFGQMLLASAQMQEFKYYRELDGVNKQWHYLNLTGELIGKCKQDLSDIRIFGLTENQDTIEAPYAIKHLITEYKEEVLEFKILNESYNEKGYFYTLEVPETTLVNELFLDIKETNFDWLSNLEGSQSLDGEWVTILKDYRILSIQNELSSYSFTNLIFPQSQYRYYRLFIESKAKPELLKVKLLKKSAKDGQILTHAINHFDVKEQKQNKQTVIDLELAGTGSVSRLVFDVDEQVDYYRTVSIQYLSDSFKTETGWSYIYNTLAGGTLSSLEKNEFEFKAVTLKKLRIFVYNEDNRSLHIKGVKVQGYVHQLWARFDEKAKYFLVYGNEKATAPKYDISRFEIKSAEGFNQLNLGNEKMSGTDEINRKGFDINPIWLWMIMILIMALLIGFSINMMKKRNAEES